MAKIPAVFLAIAILLAMPIRLSADEPKAKTLDELVKRYDVSSCKECHKEIFEQWEKSLHAKSIIGTPRTSDAFGRMINSDFRVAPHAVQLC